MIWRRINAGDVFHMRPPFEQARGWSERLEARIEIRPTRISLGFAGVLLIRFAKRQRNGGIHVFSGTFVPKRWIEVANLQLHHLVG